MVPTVTILIVTYLVDTKYGAALSSYARCSPLSNAELEMYKYQRPPSLANSYVQCASWQTLPIFHYGSLKIVAMTTNRRLEFAEIAVETLARMHLPKARRREVTLLPVSSMIGSTNVTKSIVLNPTRRKALQNRQVFSPRSFRPTVPGKLLPRPDASSSHSPSIGSAYPEPVRTSSVAPPSRPRARDTPSAMSRTSRQQEEE